MTKKQPLTNAGKIIERFGGIRPMAAKIDTPVTTVQGWKKRDVIPGTRRTQILSAATKNNIDISDLTDASISNENISAEVPKVSKAKSKKTSTKKKEPAKKVVEPVSSSVPSFASKDSEEELEKVKAEVQTIVSKEKKMPTHDRLIEEIQENNRKVVATSAWVTAALILLAVAVALFLFWPNLKENNDQLNAQSQQLVNLENQVGEVREASEKKFFGTSLPEGLQAKIDGLQNQARNISVTVDQLSVRAKNITMDALGGNAQIISERLKAMEAKIEELSGPDGSYAGLVARIRDLEGNLMGQRQLESSANQLRSIVGGADDNIGDDLADVQGEGEGALGQTLEGVSGQNLKAAAILIAFSQFRSALEREGSFEKDLALLQNLVGEDNPELQENLSRLSSHADGGVLTASGLSSELKKLTGDIVVSSLSGEDVSITEKAKARFGSIVQIEKDGEILSGTQTQSTVAKAQDYIEDGKIEDSIMALEGLEGPAAEMALPFIEKAKGTLLAEKVKAMLNAKILSQAGGENMNIPNFDMNGIKQNLENAVPFLGNGHIIKDEESGVSIRPHSSSDGFKGFSAGE